jgi:hypothetical protein
MVTGNDSDAPRLNRRRILSGVSAIPIASLLSGVTAGAKSATDRHRDPLGIALTDGRLSADLEEPTPREAAVVSKRADSQVGTASNTTRRGGGPDELSVEDVAERIDELNEAKEEEDVTFFEKADTAHVRPTEALLSEVEGEGTATTQQVGAAACNKAGSSIHTGLLRNGATLKIPSRTVDDLVDLLNAGAGTAALVAALSQGGVITAPPGWLAAAIGAVLVIIGSGLSLVDRGCGVRLSITVYTGVPLPIYGIRPQ